MSLGSVDSKRLDQHMDSIRSLEARIATTTSTGAGGSGGSTDSSCKTPATPTAAAANIDLSKVTATSQTMNQLIAAALSCNMTRVYSHLWSGPRDDTHYPTIMQDAEHHTLTHNADQDSQDRATKIEGYIMSQYSHLAQTLKDTTVGATTLLDNTIIYGISEQGDDPRNHLMKNYHIVLMGHAAGRIKGNRHVRLVGRKVTELMLTLQQVMGMTVTTYGTWDKTTKTMPEVLT
jgi:hypothetical protein